MRKKRKRKRQTPLQQQGRWTISFIVRGDDKMIVPIVRHPGISTFKKFT